MSSSPTNKDLRTKDLDHSLILKRSNLIMCGPTEKNKNPKIENTESLNKEEEKEIAEKNLKVRRFAV